MQLSDQLAALNGVEPPKRPEEPMGFFRVNDYLALPRNPNPFVIKHLVPTGGFTNIYGKPKVGKSYLSMLFALAVSNPDTKHALGFRVQVHGPVMYLQIDTPRSEWAMRWERLRRRGFDLDNIHIADMQTAPAPFNLMENGTALWLKRWVDEVKPVMVVIDTLRESFKGDENDANTMKEVFSALKIAKGAGAAAVLVSHSRKDSAFNANGGEDLMGDNRGSVYTAGAVDTVIRVTANTISYQGRSIGRGNLPIVQDKKLGLTRLGAWGEGEDSREHVEQAARDIIEANPEASKREWTRQLMATFSLSESTARRRIQHVVDVAQEEAEDEAAFAAGVSHLPPTKDVNAILAHLQRIEPKQDSPESQT